jgi:hypothetical protein
MRFFEQDHITLCYVYPALKNSSVIWSNKKINRMLMPLNVWIVGIDCELYSSLTAQTTGYGLGQNRILVNIIRMHMAAQKQEVVPESHQLRFQYEAPQKTVVCGPMDAMIGEVGPTPDDIENDLADYEYADNSITEGLLENVPKLQGTTKANADIHPGASCPVPSSGSTLG